MAKEFETYYSAAPTNFNRFHTYYSQIEQMKDVDFQTYYSHEIELQIGYEEVLYDEPTRSSVDDSVETASFDTKPENDINMNYNRKSRVAKQSETSDIAEPTSRPTASFDTIPENDISINYNRKTRVTKQYETYDIAEPTDRVL